MHATTQSFNLIAAILMAKCGHLDQLRYPTVILEAIVILTGDAPVTFVLYRLLNPFDQIQ